MRCNSQRLMGAYSDIAECMQGMNVLLAEPLKDGHDPVVKITDFGLSVQASSFINDGCAR